MDEVGWSASGIDIVATDEEFRPRWTRWVMGAVIGLLSATAMVGVAWAGSGPGGDETSASLAPAGASAPSAMLPVAQEATCAGVQGVVQIMATDPSESPAGLPFVTVEIVDKDTNQPITGTKTTADVTGGFCATGVAAGDYKVRATLDDGRTMRIQKYDDAGSLRGVYLQVPVTAENFDSEGFPTVALRFDEVVIVKDGQGGVNVIGNADPDSNFADRFVESGRIYWRAMQFGKWLEDEMSVPLADRRVWFILDSPDPKPGGAFFYRPSDPSLPTEIHLSPGKTSASARDKAETGTDGAPENGEWHELVHHLQGGIYPLDLEWKATDPDLTNHGGWSNDSTSDSLHEGFASFLPAAAARTGQIPRINQDDVYAGFGSLERYRWKPWTVVGESNKLYREDFAVAALLWDLWDGSDTLPGAANTDGVDDCYATETCEELGVLVRTDDVAREARPDIVSLHPATLWAVIVGLDPGDYSIAGLRDRLHDPSSEALGVDPVLTTATIDLDGDLVGDVSPIDFVFLSRGFHPCDPDPFCAYDFGDPVGPTDRPELLGLSTEERRVAADRPGAGIRIVNDGTSGVADAVVRVVVTEQDGESTTFTLDVPAGGSEVLGIELPAHYDFPLYDQPVPSCDSADDTSVVVEIIDDQGVTTALDTCEFEVFIGDSEGQPAVSHLVGSAAINYRVELVDALEASTDPDVITIDSGLGLDDIETALAGLEPPALGEGSLAIHGVLKLHIPALEALAPVRMPGATLQIESTASTTVGLESFKARLLGQLVIGDEVLDFDLRLAFGEAADSSGASLQSFDADLDLTGLDGDSVITSQEIVDLLGELTGGGADFDAFAAALPAMSLDGLHADFAWTPSAWSLDVVADTTIGDLGVSVLLSVDDSSTSDPRFLVGARFDDATDPASDTISLDALLGGSLGSLAAGIEFPEFAMASVFGSEDPVTNTDLRDNQRAFFCGCDETTLGSDDGLPAGLDLSGTLSLAASINVDAFDGSGARNLFDYGVGETVDLFGTLGFSLADLDRGLSLTLDQLDLRVELPSFSGAVDSALPTWLTITDPTLVLQVTTDDTTGGRSVVVQFDATAEVAVDGQVLEFDVTIGVEVNGDETIFTFTGATPADATEPAWPSPFGLDWLGVEDFGMALTVTVDSSGVAVDGGLTASFTVGTKDFSVALEFASSSETTSATIRASLDDTISLDEVLTLFDSPDLPDQLGGITVGPVAITARFGTAGAGLTVTAEGAVPITSTLTLSGSLLFSLDYDSQADEYGVVFGLRSDAVAIADLFGDDPLGLGALPPVGLIGTSDALSGTRSTLSPEEAAFYGPLFGCTDPVDTSCQFELDLPSGIHLVSSVPIPEDLEDFVKMVWVDPQAGMQLRASAPLPTNGGSIDLSSFSIRFQLGIDPPRAVREEFPWFDSANLAVEVEGLSIKIAGELGIKLGKEALTTQSACETDPRPGVWKESYPESGTFACYDLLDLQLSAGVALDGPPKLKFTGSLLTSGWYPVDFLRVDAAKLQIGVELAGSPVFTFGFLAQGGIQFGTIGKDFMGSAVIGLRTLPNPPFVVPEPKGIHLASQAGIELADIPKLYDYIVDTAEGIVERTTTDSDPGNDVTIEDLLGFDPPTSEELGIDPATLPNVSLRNIELMFGIGNFPELCIEPGLIIGGELLINAEPINQIPDALPIADDCSEVGPLSDPTECAAKEECFASVLLSATLDGIIVSGALGEVDLGLIKCRESLIDLRLTLQTQRFLVSGGCDAFIPSLDPDVEPTVLASGDLSFSLGLDGISFLGDLQIFPEPPPPGFRILVEGQAALDLASIDFSDPNALQAIDFDFHALLQADFGAEVDDTVVALLEDLRVAAEVVDGVWAEFRDSGGDPIEALISLPQILEETGEPVPDWVEDFSVGLQEFRDTLEFWGLSLPKTDDILGGFSFEFEGLEGFVILDGCYSLWPFPGTWVDGTCYAIPPGPVELLGVCDIVQGTPCSVAELETVVSGILRPILTDVAGVPADENLTLTALLDAIIGNIQPGGALFRLDCVDFRISTMDEADSVVALRIKADVFGNDVNFTLEWDLNADPLAEAGRFAEQVVNQFFGDPQPVLCEELGTTTVGQPIVGSATPEPETLDDFELTVDRSITENGTATAEIEFNIAPPDPVDVTIDWGEGTPETLTVTTQTATFTHRYLDDDPTATASDTYDVSVSAIGIGKKSGVTVRNAAPSNVALTTTAVDEGGTATISGTFVDPGTLDTHRVRIDWGDGSSLETVALGVGARTFSADHTYTDDDPTGTPSDDYTVKVTVLDDDRGRGSTTQALQVTNVAPSGTTLAPTGVIEEGAVAEFAVSFTDPGADTHTVKVDWGDGTPAELVAIPAGDRSFTAAHVYADDDPTGTPFDDVTVTVTVADDDTGSFTSTFDVTVVNVEPTIVGGPVAGDTAIALNGTYDSSDDVIDEDGVVSATIDFTDPGRRDVHTVVVDWGDGTDDTRTYATGTRQITLFHRYLDDDPTATPQDPYTIGVTLTDDDTGSDSASATLVVRDVSPVVTTDTPTQVVQYSDPGETITVTAIDVERDTLTAEVWFDEGGAATTPGLPSWLELSPDGDCTTNSAINRRTCEWTLTPVQNPATGIYTDTDPGTYTVRVRITDDDTLYTDLSATIVVLPEDARAYYIGPTYAATDDFRDDTTVVELRAIVQDITLATADPAWDPYPGDALKATTRFVDREAANAVLCEATLGYTFADEIGLATAVCEWEADIGNADAVSYVVGTIVGDPRYDPDDFDVDDLATHPDPGYGRYIRNRTVDDTVVLVARPIDESINGGGFLVLTDSEGVYRGDDGTKSNFGFNVKFNKAGTNLQGQVTSIVRADGRVYRIKTNSLTSLGVVDIDGDGNGIAEFEAKANIVDVTDEDDPISLGGNLTLQMRMTDFGEPGDADTIGFSLWDRDGELLFSSNWNEVMTIEQVLGGGNLTVHP